MAAIQRVSILSVKSTGFMVDDLLDMPLNTRADLAATTSTDRMLTYGWGQSPPLQLGDIVLAPETPFTDGPWHGVVVSTHPTYIGEVKLLLRKVENADSQQPPT
jgi:hypothetical protein